MRNILLLIVTLIILPSISPANAQTLIGADNGPGDSCAGFAEGATRISADADLNGRDVTLICNGATWEAAAGAGSGGNGAIIDRIAGIGITVDAVTIAATGDKWPDYIMCTAGPGITLLSLGWYSPSSQTDEAFYGSSVGYYEFTANGSFKELGNVDSNCGASANDIDTICEEGRCGFYGGADIYVAGGGGAPGQKVVFVTSTTYTGNLGGYSGADTLCQNSADAASLSGTFKAWVAQNNINGDPESTFTQSTVPYILVDETEIASNWPDLIDGTLSAPINVNELGNPVASGNVWTNVSGDGTATDIGYGSDNCGNWTNASSYSSGRRGNLASTTQWTSTGITDCDIPMRLYCFEQ